MQRRKNMPTLLSVTGQNLIRIVIASYFMAVGADLIPGTDLGVLFGPLLEDPLASIVGHLLTFALAFLILTGFALRTAALLLSIGVFWSSYLTSLDLGFADNLDRFWRDLALIGALMLTYLETEPRSSRRRQAIRFTPNVRRLDTKAPRYPMSKPLVLVDRVKVPSDRLPDPRPAPPLTRRPTPGVPHLAAVPPVDVPSAPAKAHPAIKDVPEWRSVREKSDHVLPKPQLIDERDLTSSDKASPA
ncbi:MAG: DoxX family protein [Pseudomonadota bacterium]